eukprot:829643_1
MGLRGSKDGRPVEEVDIVDDSVAIDIHDTDLPDRKPSGVRGVRRRPTTHWWHKPMFVVPATLMFIIFFYLTMNSALDYGKTSSSAPLYSIDYTTNTTSTVVPSANGPRDGEVPKSVGTDPISTAKLSFTVAGCDLSDVLKNKNLESEIKSKIAATVCEGMPEVKSCLEIVTVDLEQGSLVVKVTIDFSGQPDVSKNESELEETVRKKEFSKKLLESPPFATLAASVPNKDLYVKDMKIETAEVRDTTSTVVPSANERVRPADEARNVTTVKVETESDQKLDVESVSQPGSTAFDPEASRNYLIHGYVRTHGELYGLWIPGDLSKLTEKFVPPLTRHWDLVPLTSRKYRWYFHNISVTETSNDLKIKVDYRILEVLKKRDQYFRDISADVLLIYYDPIKNEYPFDNSTRKVASVHGPHIEATFPMSEVPAPVYGFGVVVTHNRSDSGVCLVRGVFWKRDSNWPQHRSHVVIQYLSSSPFPDDGIARLMETSRGEYFEFDDGHDNIPVSKTRIVKHWKVAKLPKTPRSNQWFFRNITVTECSVSGIHIKLDYRLFNVASEKIPNFSGLSVSMKLISLGDGDKPETYQMVKAEFITINGPHIEAVIPVSSETPSPVNGFYLRLNYVGKDMSFRSVSTCDVQIRVYKQDEEAFFRIFSKLKLAGQCGQSDVVSFHNESDMLSENEYFIVSGEKNSSTIHV